MTVHGKVLLRQWLTWEAGWRYGIMSTAPYEQQKIMQTNKLIIIWEAGLTPREPSIINYDVYDDTL